ncbi:MAG TPA: hypothetical protein VM076_23550 [Gemmatimonadaceae bacterium]|nr:hypothetical protein [Gemmatimonadaceae bacterium]
MRVYVNSTGLDVPDGATALDAIRAWNSAAADAVVLGERVIADSRGLPAQPDSLAHGGAIYRVLPARRRADAEEPSD